ncbi:Heavy metal transport/detoxification protein [Pseudopedobacter saltans DSM 12145]|uniref:Heavy metal transport/detoxification protein n=1 Tax=Pseudopedobacter saltans (strain ATCC 51119 / DSM 12145 / JCM 21818 / CCUG 39354 / LMG 10337 / NBRC 100064 / NCIMB 13643) TaxID=762903 RepID=F0SC40_PSESL|nr:cation transporter [Pseudopedobacter saltans]ADY50625.1 Heavy metal transport/detoxification protein [Pseudopedobacter saltans DSM 12145]
MNSLKFKTNLKCSGCVTAVAPKLDEIKGIDKWDVDLSSPEKTLKVEGNVQPAEVERAFEKAGYKAELEQ